MPIVNVQLSARGAIIDVLIGPSLPRIQVLRAQGQKVLPPFAGKGLLDTGATSTMIDKAIAAALNLSQTGTVQIRTPSTGAGTHTCGQFDIHLALPLGPGNQIVRAALPVLEGDFSSHGFHLLIGRDVLSRCLMVYNGTSGFISLSF